MDSLKLLLTAFVTFALVLFNVSATAAQPATQPVTIGTDSALLSEPRADASVIAQLKQGTAGEQVGKQGMFVNIKTPAGTGWVFSFNVRAQPAGTAAAGGGAAAKGLNTTGRVNVASTIGIRGLSADDLRKTSVDPEQLKLLDTYAASAQDGEAAAAASGLTPVRLEYFSR